MLLLALPETRKKQRTPGGMSGTRKVREWRIFSLLKTELRVSAERALQLLVHLAPETDLTIHLSFHLRALNS